MEACLSNNAGRYLCDFVYYKSLHEMKGRGLFVHVPDLGKVYTVKQMTQALALILEKLVKQVKTRQMT